MLHEEHRTIAILAVCIVALCGIFIVATLTKTASASKSESGSATCPSDAVVARVEATPIYSDSKGSVVDPANLHLHEQQIKPLRDFVTDASRRADSSDPAEQECAMRMMLEWAKDRAMEEPPSDFGGLRELERFGIALNIIALKLRADGQDIAPLLDWLGAVNHTVSQKFGARGRVDNLYVWSGVAAASYAVLSGDESSRRYADEVWRQGIAAIRPDGFVDSELRRGGHALIYHLYDLSALLTLQAFRNAWSESVSPQERSALQPLVDRVSGSLCDSSAMMAAAGGVAQDTPQTIEFAPVIAFAGDLADPRFKTCGPPNIPTTDPVLGGDLIKTAGILAHHPPGRAP